MHTKFALLLLALLLAVTMVSAQDDDAPPAPIENDEGGPVSVTGSVAYTSGFFTAGVAQPLVILEDQAGFVDRNTGFLMSPESQVLGVITSDFYTSPFTYTVVLPEVPQAEARDVDNDEEEEAGVMIYAVAYWTNTWGDPYLEERDLYGGGWSTAYASTHVDQNPSAEGNVIGGKYIVYAPDDAQGFPSGFGDDGELFTEDDPIVTLPQGYTVVDMDTDPFTFDRSREPVIDLIEGEGAEQEDFSTLSYTEAFDALIEMFREKYAYTELKGIDWDAKKEEFRPRFEEADTNADSAAYQLALRDFIWSIPDGHLSAPTDNAQFAFETAGGLGMAIRDVDDGRTIVNFVLEGGPAEAAGIELGTEILEINGVAIDDAVDATMPWSLPFSTTQNLRLQQLRYVLRFPDATDVEVTYQNPGESEPTTVTLTTVGERQSFAFSSFNQSLTGSELPLEYRILPSGYVYVKIFSFFDNELLTIQLWERMIQLLNDSGVPGLIIDMRQNGGGSGFLADQMAAYFFDEPLVTGNTETYDENTGEFATDPNREAHFYLPPENLRYSGAIAVIVGPACSSACEFFSYNMTLQDRAAIVGQYASGGLGGGQATYLMPEDIQLQYSIGRNLDAEGNIIIEGVGVIPTVKVPVTEETLFAESDVVLDAAVEFLDQLTAINIVDGGQIVVGEPVTGEIAEQSVVRYTLQVTEGQIITIETGTDKVDLDLVLNLYLDDGETLVAQSDVGGGGETESLPDFEIPVDLTLIVEIAGFEGGTGPFTLSVTEPG